MLRLQICPNHPLAQLNFGCGNSISLVIYSISSSEIRKSGLILHTETRKNKYAGNKRKLSTDGNTGSIIKRVKNNDDQNVPNQNIFTEEALANLKIYNELKTQYEEEGVNQQTHQFLSRISRKKILDNEKLNKVPLMQHLSNAAKAMMLSEFEIAAWATWLDKIDLVVPDEYTPEDYILFTSFYIKMSLNDEDFLNGMFQSYFN